MKRAYIKEPVANLWKKPVRALQEEWIDRNLETQLGAGDCVNVLFEEGDFAYVESESQDVFHDSCWSFYRGYVEKSALEVDNLWKNRVQTHAASALLFAKKFLGSRYLWGGCSNLLPESNTYPLRGVDCSGLVHLAYKAIGVRLPRNAHDQYLKTTRVPFKDLKEGDLLFSSESGMHGRVDHVMMVAEDGTVIEAVMSQGIVRQIHIKEKWGGILDPELSSQMIGNIGVHTGIVFD